MTSLFIVAQSATLSFTDAEFLTKLVTGTLSGMLGQAARVAVGMKKTNDEAQAQKTSFAQKFDWGQLFVSLLLGAAAGAIAMFTAVKQLDSQAFATLFTAGYAGSDFIEGFIRNQAAVPQKSSGAATSQQVQKVTNLDKGLN
jgi:hypothetical protein